MRNWNCALSKQELVIADPSACIKLILWEESVDVLGEGVTYLLQNIRLGRETYGTVYLKNPKSEQFSFEESENFSEAVVEEMQKFFDNWSQCNHHWGWDNLKLPDMPEMIQKTSQFQGTAMRCESCHMVQK